MLPGAAPPNMKMSDSPLIKGAKALGGCLVGVWPRWLTGQPPEAFGFFPPLLRGIFIGVAHAAWGRAIEHENYFPPLEWCRGWLSPTGRPTPKADAFCPSQE